MHTGAGTTGASEHNYERRGTKGAPDVTAPQAAAAAAATDLRNETTSGQYVVKAMKGELGIGRAM